MVTQGVTSGSRVTPLTMQEFIDAIKSDWATTVPYLVLYLGTTCLDILFGMGAAFKTNKLCSSISRWGIAKKMMMLCTVLLAALFDGVLPPIQVNVMGLQLSMTFAAVGCVWWIVNELLSITENAALCGVWLPKRLKEALAILRHEIDSNDDQAQLGQGDPPGKV